MISLLLFLFFPPAGNIYMADDDDHLEGNAGVPESPLLIVSSSCSSSTEPELELTSVTGTDVARQKFRLAFKKLRCILAFTQAAAGGGGGGGDQYLNINIGDDENVQNELLDEFLGGSTTASHTVIDVPAEEQDWLSNLVKSQSTEQLHQVAGDVEGLASALQTDTEHGINDDDQQSIASRRHRYGSNRIETPINNNNNNPPIIKQIVWETIKDPIIVILLLCALLSLGFGVIKHGSKGWPDGGGIFVAVFVVVAVTAYCKIWPRRQIFSKVATAGDCFTVDVTRNGKRQRISVLEVVVGDVVSLKIDDQVPADGLYIEGHSFQVEESAITDHDGQAIMRSLKFKDRHRDPFLLSGSKVLDGYARMLITAVGMKASAQWHRHMLMSEHGYDANQKTPLERKLDKLAMHIAKVGFLVAFLVLLIHLIRYFKGNKTSTIRDVFFAVIGILVTPIAIASTAIPEGLLLAVVVPVAYSRNRMAAEKKALVRKLAALEEIGSTTVICTNGKGNLTSQNLEVTRFWHGQDTFSSIAPNVRKLLLQGVDSDNTEVSPGSSTESVEFAIRNWADQSTIEGNTEQVSPHANGLHQRGDPEAMLANCCQYYDRHGNIKEITDEVKDILMQNIVEMKSKFPQCIGFSCSDASEENKTGDDKKEQCFTLIGVAGLSYPCLPEIKDVVNDCQSAGVEVKLVTGSELQAAIDIARECGILRSNEEPATGLVIEGHDFQNHPEEDRLGISNKIRVLARASTSDRRCLVQDLKKRGHVVAVTGDSVGDADALKEANVGLSLGIQGTDKAKENSDIIILNDNFESIATAMRWGRSMYCKIQTYTQFQLTVSISSLVVDFVTAISAREPPKINAVATISAGKAPFAALQVLWAKLIVGVLAALTITIEEPAKKLQYLPSVKKTEPFVTNIMWKNIVEQALYPVIILLTINFKGESVLKVDPKVKDTMIFNTFVLWQLVSIVKTKKFDGINVIKWIQREKLFWTILISMGCLQVVIVEALERFAGTKRLNWLEWAECIGLAVLAWPIGLLVHRCISSAP